MSKCIESKEDFFLSDTNKLAYRFTSPVAEETSHPAILLMHGSSSEKGKGCVLFSELQDQLAENSIASLAYDTRGVGESEGNFSDSTLENRLTDAENAYHLLIEQQRIDEQRLALLGLSMSGHVAARFVGKHPELFKALIMVNPAAYGEDAEDKRLKPSTEFTQAIRRERNWIGSPIFGSFAKYNGTLLMVKSELDTVVPHEVTDLYLDNFEDYSMITIMGIPHAFMSGNDQRSIAARNIFYKESIKFLKETL